MITPGAKKRVLELVQSGVDEGAELLLDGREVRVPGYENGNFVGPTVLHKVKVKSLLIIHMDQLMRIWYLMHSVFDLLSTNAPII